MNHSELSRGDRYRPYGFPEVHRAIRRCSCLSDRAKLVWWALVDRQGATGDCFPSVETIGSDLGGIDARLVRRYLRELEETGLICRAARLDQKGRRTSNTIEFIWRPLDELSPDSTNSAPEISPDSRDRCGADSGDIPSPDSTDRGTRTLQTAERSNITKPQEGIQKNKEKHCTVTEQAGDASDPSAELVEAIRDYVGTVKLGGRPADSGIVRRTASGLRDIRAFPVFRARVTERLTPESKWGLLPLLATDAYALWQQGIARTENNPEQGSGEPAYDRFLRESLVRGKADYENLRASPAPVERSLKKKDTWVPGLRRADIDSALASLLGESPTQ